MRKLLLAGVAVVGSVGVASAQTATMPMSPTQGLPTQYNAIMAGNNSNNSDGSPLGSGPNVPTPGSVVIHINGRVNFYAAVSGSSLNDVAGNKLAPQQFLEYFRLYPGFDGLATNGLRYGGIVEIRQNFAGQTYNLTGATSNGTAFGASASGNSSTSTLYVRREAVYFGTNQLGIVRLGQDDGPFSQFDGGVTTFQNFNDGAWNGDLPGAIVSNAQPNFPFWSGIGKEYASDKAVYFSPTFFGFDGAVAYIPSAASANDAACTVAGSGCSQLSSSTTISNNANPTNIYEIMGRYRGNFAGVGIYGIAGFSGSGHVHTPSNAAGFNGQYNGFSVTDVGLAVSYAGVTVGGNGLFGAYNGQYSLQPQGAKGATAWLVGVQYANGPWTLGASYYNFQEAGSTATLFTTQRYDDGLAAGLTYSVAPGMVVYVSYLYGQAHQGNVNLNTGAVGGAYNDVHSTAFSLGTRMFW